MQALIFKYEHDNRLDELTTVEINGEIWFVAADVCKLLDLTNPTESLKSIDDDEKLTSEMLRSGQRRKVNLVNESGLYTLIFKSSKESARKFRKWVTKEVLPSIRKTGSYGIDRSEPLDFVNRYMVNYGKVSKGYFSVINQLYIELYGRLEHAGYKIPNKAINGQRIRPDVSVGKCFASYLDSKYPEHSKNFKMYSHNFDDINLSFDARQYPNSLLPIFIEYMDDFWIPQNAQKYFQTRDLLALDYLPKLLR